MELTVEKYDGKIGVAVSGGIDSMCLLHAYCSVNQDLTVINVEHGIRGENSLRDTDFVRAYCKLNNIPFLTRSVNALSSAKPGESTETCARRLRYEFFDELLSSGTVKKIALAHHADDILDTFFLSFLHEGRLSTFMPVSFMDRTGITLIRPFIYVEEKYLAGLCRRYDLPIVHNPCPEDKHTRREDMKNLVEDLDKRFDGSKKLMLSALFNPSRNNLWDKCESYLRDEKDK